MLKRNTAVAYFPIGRFISTTDGSEVTTGTVVATYSKDGTAGSIAGTPTYNATSKEWGVALLAAETNGALIGLNFTLAGAVPIHYTISTDAKLVSELNDAVAAPTAAQVRTELDSNSTKLAFLTGDAYAIVNDAVFGNAQLVRSKTPANSLSIAPDNTAYVNVLKWSGGMVPVPTTTGVPTVALATAPPTAAQIRTEMDANSTKLANLSGDAYARIGVAGVGLTNLGDARIAKLDANVSSRSTFAGGAVASVAAPVTVGTNNDKTGYSISGTKTTLDDLRDFDPSADTVAHVTLVDTTTANTDMRGTDGAAKAGDAMSLTTDERTTLVSLIFAYVTEGTTTFVQAVRGWSSVLLAKASGLGTTTAVYRDVADTKDRITATVDADGNRTAITRDLN